MQYRNSKLSLLCRIAILIQTCVFVSCSTSQLDWSRVEHVELDRLLLAPAHYHGRLVQTRGHVQLEFEGNFIFEDSLGTGRLANTSLPFGTPYNALWLNFDEVDRAAPIRSLASVVARVDTSIRGHMGLAQATLHVLRIVHERPLRGQP